MIFPAANHLAATRVAPTSLTLTDQRCRQGRTNVTTGIMKRQVIAVEALTLSLPLDQFPTLIPIPDPTTPDTTNSLPPTSVPQDPGGTFTIPEGTTSPGGTITLDPPSASTNTSSSTDMPPASSSQSDSQSASASGASTSEVSVSTSAVFSFSVSVTVSTGTATVTIATYLTTSGSKVWTATTTQALVSTGAVGTTNERKFASNTGAIVGVIVGSLVALIISAVILFLCLTRRRRRQGAEPAKRVIEARRESAAHLRNEVDDDGAMFDIGPHRILESGIGVDVTAVHHFTGSKGESFDWPGDDREDLYTHSASQVQHSSLLLEHPSQGVHAYPRSVCASVIAPNSTQSYNLSSTPLPILRPGGTSYDEKHYQVEHSRISADGQSDDEHRATGSSSAHSHVQFTLSSSLGHGASEEDGVPQRQRKSSNSSRPVSPGVGFTYNPMGRNRSWNATPELLRRNTSTRTGHTTTEESAFPATPPAVETFAADYIAAPPVHLTDNGSIHPSSLLNPPTQRLPMMNTMLSAGPSRKHRGSLVLDKLPAFSYIPPVLPKEDGIISPPTQPPLPSPEDVGQPSPDPLLDVEIGKEQLNKMRLVRIPASNTSQTSLRDYMDYSRPVMTRDTLRMESSSSIATQDLHGS